MPMISHLDFCNQREQQWHQNGEHQGIPTQYMQDTGNVIIMQCFGYEVIRKLPTKISGIPISLPHGFSLLEFFPPRVLSWNSLAYEAGRSWNSPGLHMAWQESPYIVSRLKSPGPSLHNRDRTQASTRENESLCEEEELELASDDKVECDLSNMKITEGLHQYFPQTERHREDPSLQQQLDEECPNVNVDHGLYFNHHRSAEAPPEKSWEQRQAEMKRLYGNSAPKILAMEAALQLSFDKLCEKRQLKYWPVIPLKF